MANQSFSTILEQLGYGTVDESSGKSIPSCEWLFEKEETKELLMWLCNNLKPTNVLLNEDLRQYVIILIILLLINYYEYLLFIILLLFKKFIFVVLND